MLSRGDYSVFVTRPISVVMLAIAAILLVVTVLPAVRKTRDTVFQED